MITSKIIKRRYSSGFQANLVLRPSFKQHFFGLMVDFGSSDKQKVAGTAHFLEHELFNKQNGDLSHKFEVLGAQVNAFTSFNETMFYCSGVDHNPKLINLLFKLVGQPYFSDVNVHREQPIIQQELAMYQDEPNWSIEHSLMVSLFGKSNLSLDVAGSQTSIGEIDKETLTQTYSYNYLPQNLSFVGCGSFTKSQVENILLQVGRLQAAYFKKRHAFPKEVPSPKGRLTDTELTTKTPSHLFGVGLFLPNFQPVCNSLNLAQILLEMKLEAKFGVLSPWFAKLKEQRLLHTPPQTSVTYTRQGSFAIFSGTGPHSQKVIRAVKDELMKPLKQSNYENAKKFFELQKKELVAQKLRSLNNLSSLAITTAENSLTNENQRINLRHLQTMSFKNYLHFNEQLLKNVQTCSAYFGRKN